jgi:hypothetical protein
VAEVTPSGSAPLPARLVPMTVDVPNGSAPTTVAPPTAMPTAAPLRPVAESAPPAPPVRQTGTVLSWDESLHVAQAGDTFQKISARYYGSDAYAQALLQYNRNHPQTSDALHQDGALKAGDKVFVPPAEILEQKHGSVLSKPAAGSPGR